MGKLTISMAMFNGYVKLPESKFNVDEQKSSVYGHGEMVGQSFYSMCFKCLMFGAKTSSRNGILMTIFLQASMT